MPADKWVGAICNQPIYYSIRTHNNPVIQKDMASVLTARPDELVSEESALYAILLYMESPLDSVLTPGKPSAFSQPKSVRTQLQTARYDLYLAAHLPQEEVA